MIPQVLIQKKHHLENPAFIKLSQNNAKYQYYSFSTT